jgi:hypothetical protein
MAEINSLKPGLYKDDNFNFMRIHHEVINFGMLKNNA